MEDHLSASGHGGERLRHTGSGGHRHAAQPYRHGGGRCPARALGVEHVHDGVVGEPRHQQIGQRPAGVGRVERAADPGGGLLQQFQARLGPPQRLALPDALGDLHDDGGDAEDLAIVAA